MTSRFVKMFTIFLTVICLLNIGFCFDSQSPKYFSQLNAEANDSTQLLKNLDRINAWLPKDLQRDQTIMKIESLIEHFRPLVVNINQKLHQPTQLLKYANQEAIDEQLHEVNEVFCHTPQCVISASKMENLIDWKVDPCDDFYDFACGRFVKESMLHDRRDSLSVFSLTDDKLKDQLRRLFTREIESDEIRPYRMAKMLYKSCINSTVADIRGTEPLRNLIDTVGGWPMLLSWNESGWDLERSIMKLREHFGESSGNIFRKMRLTVRSHNGSAADESTGDNDSHGKPDLRIFMKAFRSYLIDIAVILGANRDTVHLQIDDAIEFQRELIKLSSHRETRPINIEAINVLQSEIHVKFLLTQWLDLFEPLPVQFFADDNKQLELGEFLIAFEKLLMKTSKRALANYFIMRIIGFSSQFMTTQMKARALQFRMELFGVKQKEEGWKHCVDVVSRFLPLAAEAMFSKEYFDLESKQTAIDIALGIRDAFEESLASIAWMTIEMKSKVSLKINNIIAKLKFPRELLGDNEVDLFYRKVSIEQQKYLESVFKLAVFSSDWKFILIQTGISLGVDDNAGSVGVLSTVDVKDFNKILFPAGVLQREILSPERPKYLNYGTSGFILGYIFSQAFESFQQSTEYLPTNITEKISCFIRQYDGYVDPETGIRNDGKQTLDGNIADFTSLENVYASYKNWISRNGNELRLPALRLSNAQFFWLSYAQLFCSINRPEKRRNLSNINPHSIERFRVIGPLSNSQDFAKAFDCPNNSPMNPSSKCFLF